MVGAWKWNSNNSEVEVGRTWIHGLIAAEHAGEDLELGHEPGGPSPRPGSVRARRHVVAPPATLELEQPAASAGAGAAVEVVRRRAPVEAHCIYLHSYERMHTLQLQGQKIQRERRHVMY